MPSCQGDKIYDISRELLYSPFQGQKCPSNFFSQPYFYRFLANFKDLVWSDPTEKGKEGKGAPKEKEKKTPKEKNK